jgi:hypothetical protein
VPDSSNSLTTQKGTHEFSFTIPTQTQKAPTLGTKLGYHTLINFHSAHHQTEKHRILKKTLITFQGRIVPSCLILNQNMSDDDSSSDWGSQCSSHPDDLDDMVIPKNW